MTEKSLIKQSKLMQPKPTAYLTVGIKLFTVLSLFVWISACAILPMDQPISAKGEEDFQASLRSLRLKIEPYQFESLEESVGILMLTEEQSVDRNDFLGSVIDGRTPRQIIKLSQQGRQQLQQRPAGS